MRTLNAEQLLLLININHEKHKMKSTNLTQNILKNRRKMIGLTQKNIADALGYRSAQFISNWERGLSHPPLKALRDIAKIYQLSWKDLLNLIIIEEIFERKKSMRQKFTEI